MVSLLVILIVMIGGFAILNEPSILLGGGLALLVFVVAEWVWSRQPTPPSSH
ncbi:MAG TPA: hypothetical protein VFE96_04765 [Candidatus Bathyarchaeia archaeon]|nr:hypothetical protein [Candidatus Bathyarchaeia archaeon]